jgi:hypothetical protein
MVVAQLREIDNIPSLGALVGSTQSQAMLDHINSKWGGTASVSFGQINNPMNDNFRNFMNLIHGQIARTDRVIQEVTQSVLYPEHWRVIDSEEALAAAPASMQPAILMTPGVFELFREGKLSAWDWNPDTFPKEDVYGKQLDNGKVVIDPRDPSILPEYIVSEWNSAEKDFEMTEEQQEILEKSREYITKLLDEEMGDGGSRRDITDLSNIISI